MDNLTYIESIVHVVIRGRADSPRYFDCDGVPVSVGFVKAAGFDCAAWDVWPPRQSERDVALSSGREIDRPGFESLAIPILRAKYEEPFVPLRPDSIDFTPMPVEPAPLPTNRFFDDVPCGTLLMRLLDEDAAHRESIRVLLEQQNKRTP